MAEEIKCRLQIGITGPDHGGFIPWIFTKYAVSSANAETLRLTPSGETPPLALDGLIIGGGTDIEPGRYGMEEPVLATVETGPSMFRRIFGLLSRRFTKEVGIGYVQPEPERDCMEFNLLDEAVNRGIPVLGICRGAQIINVYFGGTLHQDIRTFKFKTPHIKSIFPKKEVTIKPGSMLANIINKNRCPINSLHKQAVDELGRGLTISAKDQNGVVQAVEHTRHPFLLGVQWHPEYLPQKSEQRRIFRSFIEAVCSVRRGSKNF